MANTFTVTMTSAGFMLGPLVTGFLQDALGDLRLSLIILSFTALSLTAAGLLLRAPQSRQVPSTL